MPVYALGLGELQTHSALNQPFDADLEILSTNASELSGLEVKMASPEDFSRAGIERLPVLEALRFKIIKKGSRHYVHISSRQPILEPYLNFLVEVNWSRGRLLREFTVLLDPPELLGGEAAGVESPEASESRPSTPPPAPRRSRPQPAPTPAAPADRGEDFPMVYGPVERNENLWNIAEEMRGDLDASLPQVMMALLRNNPEAFINNNVNLLKSGYVLRIDNKQSIYTMSAGRAEREFRHQYQLWLDYKQRRARSAEKRMQNRKPANQQSKRGGDAGKTSPGQGKQQGVLTLERPKGDKQVGGHLESESVGQGKESEELKRLRKELAEAQQSAENNQKQNEAMHDRLKAMEEQIAALQRLMAVRSDELTSLQQKLDTEPAEEAEPQKPSSEEQGLFDKLGAGMSSMLRTMRENPQSMGIIGGGLLLLLTSIWLYMRRRKQGGLERFEYADSRGRQEFEVPMNDSWDVADDFEEDVVVRDWQPPERETPRSESMDEDPITQADIFVAYGNLDSAIEVMEGAVVKWPDNGEYQRKLAELKDRRAAAAPSESEADDLLDTDVATNTAAVNTQLEEETLLTDEDLMAFREELQSEGDVGKPEVDDIHHALSDFGIELGEDMDMHPVRSQDGEERAGGDQGLEFDLSDIHSELENLTVDEGLLSASEHEGSIAEFDLEDLEAGLEESELQELQPEPSTAGPSEPDAGPAGSRSLLEEPDLDLSGLDDNTLETSDEEGVGLDELLDEEISGLEGFGMEEAPGREPQETGDESGLESFDLEASDVSSSDLQEPSLDESSLIEETPDTASTGEERDEETLELDDEFDTGSLIELEDHEPDLLNDVDEVGTKLDLARAYIDMGDPEGARSILDEVVKEGNDHQVQEANGLLGQIQ